MLPTAPECDHRKVMDRARVLVVDDEPSIVDAVATALGYAGFEVDRAASGTEALTSAARCAPDAVVLDIMMPGVDGVEVCRHLRACGIDAPVLFLTAKHTVTDKVVALQAGGDDYVVKPFSLVEVVARVQAMTRRYRAQTASPAVLRFADLDVHPDGHQVFRAGQEIVLTATEFRLLQYFVTNHDLVLTKEQILDEVWPADFDGPLNIVETYVAYLRKKLNAHGPPLIHTVRLVGYVLREGGT